MCQPANPGQSRRTGRSRAEYARYRTRHHLGPCVYELLRLDAPTQLTTAATDVLLAAFCLASVRYVARHGNGAARLVPWKIAFWLFGAGALMGAAAHALHIPDELYRLVWAPIYLTLALAVACFLLGMLHDVAPERLRKLQPLVLGLGVLCFAIATIFPTTFLVFLAWQGLGLIVATAAYLGLWYRRRLPGAGWISLGLLISIAAAVIQGTGTVSFTLIWPFDHNGVFHLVQLPGLMAIAYGLTAERAAGHPERGAVAGPSDAR
jgi:hypothetical protein